MIDHQDILLVMDYFKQIVENTQRIAVALERSNDLQEDANTINRDALETQKKHHEEQVKMTEAAGQRMEQGTRAMQNYTMAKGIMKKDGEKG